MTATNQNQETNDDGLKVNYDDETGQVTLEWDPQDPKWNWLGDLTEDQIRDTIMKNALQILEDSQNESENI
jgi:hypothetical protein